MKDLPGNPHPVAFVENAQIDNFCEPEQLLPSQWRAFCTSTDWSPERNLAFKVLVQAFRDYCLLPKNQSGGVLDKEKHQNITVPVRIEAMRENVRWWIEDPNPNCGVGGAFSFAFCCETVLADRDVERSRKEALAFLDAQDAASQGLFPGERGTKGKPLKARIKLPRQRAVIHTGTLSGNEHKASHIMHTGTATGNAIRKRLLKKKGRPVR